MDRKFKVNAIIFIAFLFLLNACQSPILSGLKSKSTNTPLTTETLPPPTQIPVTPTPSEIPPTPTQANIKISDIDQMEMIYIPAGEFIMGTEDIEAQRIFHGNGVHILKFHSRKLH